MRRFYKQFAGLLALGVAAAALQGCSSSQGVQADASLQVPNLAVPASGITPVKDVIVTPRENEQIELTAAANGTFKFEQLQAVLWCRASQHAKSAKYADWTIVKVDQVRAASADTPMVGRGLVQLIKTPAPVPGGKKPPIKDWCKDVPRVAVT